MKNKATSVRRSVRAAVLTLTALLVPGVCAAAQPPDDFVPRHTALGEAYADYFLLGNVVSGPSDLGAGLAGALLKEHFNVVTMENAMKPDHLTASGGGYRFDAADSLARGAAAAGFALHGHTLVWHSQSPAWLNKRDSATPLTRAEAKANLAQYIQEVAAHFRGRVISWDVVNEAFYSDGAQIGADWRTGLRTDARPGGWDEPSFWYQAYANGADADKGESGADYLYDAFVLARRADPGAKLFYNDYNDDIPSKVWSITSMIKELNAQYAREYPDDPRQLIEGVGMQSHYYSPDGDYPTRVQHVEDAIKAYIEAGVDIAISELDICATKKDRAASPEDRLFTPERAARQAETYARLFALYKQYAAHIDRVTLWGLTDACSWRSDRSPLLWAGDGTEKAALSAALDPEGYLRWLGFSVADIPPPEK
ncbi:hypothetical protein FACS1894196_1420 [Clostridia bacterium]|nr:hypothetical protein FACS1894196_1420 [Clostridia bacterium]